MRGLDPDSSFPARRDAGAAALERLFQAADRDKEHQRDAWRAACEAGADEAAMEEAVAARMLAWVREQHEASDRPIPAYLYEDEERRVRAAVAKEAA